MPGAKLPMQFALKITYAKYRLQFSYKLFLWHKTNKQADNVITAVSKVVSFLERNEMLLRDPLAYMINFLTLFIPEAMHMV